MMLLISQLTVRGGEIRHVIIYDIFVLFQFKLGTK